MTVETTTTIELKDITAVEFVCKDCRAKTIRKLNDKLVIPTACNNCGKPWFIADGDEHKGILLLARKLQQYGQGEFNYLRLQVANITEHDRK